jgi:hypothetical protein
MFEKKFAKKVRKYYKLLEGGRGGEGRVENCHSNAWGHQLHWWPQAITIKIIAGPNNGDSRPFLSKWGGEKINFSSTNMKRLYDAMKPPADLEAIYKQGYDQTDAFLQSDEFQSFLRNINNKKESPEKPISWQMDPSSTQLDEIQVTPKAKDSPKDTQDSLQ